MQLSAVCVNSTGERIDNKGEVAGLTLGKVYKVEMYNANSDNDKKPPMLRITNDDGSRASYRLDRFYVNVDYYDF